jgi:hypothetical protein
VSKDIILDKTSKPFSGVFQSSSSSKTRYCPLCSKAGIESVVNDEDICSFCGDVGIVHGVNKDDDLFVVNSVGGGGDSSGDPSESNLAFGTFGGFEPLDKTTRPQQQKTLQDALKETEIS